MNATAGIVTANIEPPYNADLHFIFSELKDVIRMIIQLKRIGVNWPEISENVFVNRTNGCKDKLVKALLMHNSNLMTRVDDTSRKYYISNILTSLKSIGIDWPELQVVGNSIYAKTR
jgi:hypothetical protein